MGKTYTILLPILNEASSVGNLIEEINRICYWHNIFAVDSGSDDGSDDIVIEKRVPLLRVNKKGKGIAVREAFKYINTDYVIMMDSDGTYPPHYVRRIFGSLDHYEVVIGHRKWKDKNSMSVTNKIGNFGLSLLASALYGYWVKDLCSGMWGFRKETLDKFELTSDRFTLEADLFVNSMRNGCKIYQIPIHYRPRSGDPPKLRIWDGFDIAWFLIKRRFIR